jgi:alpha-D-xyloside xylohydrolase
VDFGEAAPLNGIYASGRTGFFEHNLLSAALQQNDRRHHQARPPARTSSGRAAPGPAASDIRCTGAATRRRPTAAWRRNLRGGLSFGLSGFTFWSHDAGGFVGKRQSADFYRRWLAFSVAEFAQPLSRHRPAGAVGIQPGIHGPTSASIVEMRYRLMPYIWAQAHDSLGARTADGAQRCSWNIPERSRLLEAWTTNICSVPDHARRAADARGRERAATSICRRQLDRLSDPERAIAGGWHEDPSRRRMPVVVLVRDGSVIPHIGLAQSMLQLDWSKLELVSFADKAARRETDLFACRPTTS